MRQLYKQELAINIVKGEDGGRIFDGLDSLTGIKNLFRFQEGSFFHDIKGRLTHSYSYSLTYSLTHSYSLTHLHTHSLSLPLSYSLTHS